MRWQSNSGDAPESTFFAAYVGSSMYPTLREPEIMEIIPYDNRPPCVGDVAFFIPSEAEQPVVHRIIRVTASGLTTRGDNNGQEDPVLIRPTDIKGQVVAARRGQKRRRITGGTPGRLTGCLLHWRRAMVHSLSPLLLPLYRVLSHGGLIAGLMPTRFRPRVIVFHSRGRDQFQLLSGRRVIGRYDDYTQRWQIQRPFHLFVKRSMLPGQQNRERSERQVLTKRQRPVDLPFRQDVLHSLVLADGSRWEISAADEKAADIVAQLGDVMQLPRATEVIEPSRASHRFRLLVQVDSHTATAECYVPLASENDGVVVCSLSPCECWAGPHVNLARLSLVFAREAQSRGGALIHGALAEWNGMGVILAAPGGTGKTTASNRLPAPWRSLSDDTTLVVRDPQGNYRAHPWPTWSRFMDGGPGGTWDVQRTVPLKGIFFLDQATEERVERVGCGQAVSLLGEVAGQVSIFMAPGLWKGELHALHLERFNNLCALAKVVPAHTLHISLIGTFWQHIEQALREAS